jgi:hypothetical protein
MKVQGESPAPFAFIGGLLKQSTCKLIAIQNGINPNRVAAFTMQGDRITATTTLEANHPDFLEPTLGYINGNDLIYIANSQWPLVNEKAELQTEKLRDPVVLKLTLNKNPRLAKRN